MQNVKNPIVLTNKNKAFKLTADSVKNNYVMWEVTQDTLIILSETSIPKDHNNRNVVLDTLKIPSSEIKSVYIDGYNVGNAGIAILLAFVVVGGLLILVNNSGPFRNDNK
ncbi:MAG: hypothetical protein IPJ23_16500 [Ignavibacteriales bacterium]|nr:hypothetical protein [Ignavibacteriales bacterium]